jgi:hypothetical protein
VREDYRNSISVIFGPTERREVLRRPQTLLERVLTLFGRRYTREMEARSVVFAHDYDAIARYGPRSVEVVLPEGDLIRSRADAQALADTILRDLSLSPLHE